LRNHLGKPKQEHKLWAKEENTKGGEREGRGEGRVYETVCERSTFLCSQENPQPLSLDPKGKNDLKKEGEKIAEGGRGGVTQAKENLDRGSDVSGTSTVGEILRGGTEGS